MLVDTIHSFQVGSSILHAPLCLSNVSAGFPSPAENYIDKTLDMNELLVSHPEATFFVRVSGDSMCDAGISHNDILVVDRSLQAKNHDIIVAILFGEFTVKRWYKKANKAFLVAENPQYPPIEITEASEFEIWGVVTYVIHSVCV